MKCFVTLCCLVVGIATASAQTTWTLEQCITYAVDHNISIKQSEINNEINNNTTIQSKAGVLPSINAGLQHTYNFGRTIDRYTNTFANTEVLSQNFYLSGSMTIWSGLSQYNTIRANQYNYLSGRENLEQQKYDLSLNVANAYLNVVYCDELLKIAKVQYDITKEQLDRTQKLADAGNLAKSTVYDLKAQLANEDVNVTTADNNYAIAILSLTQLMNLDSITAPFLIVKPVVDVEAQPLAEASVQNIYDIALKNQHSIKSSEYAVLSAEKRVLSSKGRISPTLSVNGSVATGYSGLSKDIKSVSIVGYDTTAVTTGGQFVLTPRTSVLTSPTPFVDQFKNNLNKSFGFTLNVPIFNGLSTYTSVKNAKLNALNARYNQELNEQNLYKTITQAYVNAKAALNKYNASKLSVEASEQSFMFAEQKFNVGALNAFEYSQAKSRLTNAQSNLVQAKYDYLFKLKVLDFYQGKPLTF